MLSRRHTTWKQESDLQEEETLDLSQNVATKQHNGYTFTTVKNGYIRKDGRPQWIVCLPDGCDDNLTHKLVTDCLPDHMTAVWEGKPDEDGLCCVTIAGSEADLREELDNCHSILPKDASVEQDIIMAIPELGDERHDEKDPSLMEKTSQSTNNHENELPWGLDRIDDRSGLDKDYTPPFTGKGVHVFVLDTGIRTTHADFGGRALPAFESLLDGYGTKKRNCHKSDNTCAIDRDGHGTHCAGTVAGLKYGVAKNAKVYAVKVLNDDGRGAATQTLEGYEFVRQQKTLRPAVVSASLGGTRPGYSKGEEIAINNLLGAGVLVVAAAGNDGWKEDSPFAGKPGSPYACSSSPGNIPAAIVVGNMDKTDTRSGDSQYDSLRPGFQKCVDIFAPGENIMSASSKNDNGGASKSGTSMATPHVSGAVALLLEEDPAMTPRVTEQKLKARATKNAVKDPKGSPNLLLYVGRDSSTATMSPVPAQSCSDTPLCGKRMGQKMPMYLRNWAVNPHADGSNLEKHPYYLRLPVRIKCGVKVIDYWLRLNCAKTCGFCTPTDKPPTPPTPLPMPHWTPPATLAPTPPPPPPHWTPPPTASCSWQHPHGGGMALCQDGTQSWFCVRDDHGQRVQCPSAYPEMCASKSCGGGMDYCCERSCHSKGGPRKCE